jgi:hypothetical protein
MKLTCPENPGHKEFLCAAIVYQTWRVDSHADFVDSESACDGVFAGPSVGADFHCVDCGAEAKKEST